MKYFIDMNSLKNKEIQEIGYLKINTMQIYKMNSHSLKRLKNFYQTIQDKDQVRLKTSPLSETKHYIQTVQHSSPN